MCGRYALFAPSAALSAEFGAALDVVVAPRYNIAPSQPVLAVRRNAPGRREFTHLSWGSSPPGRRIRPRRTARSTQGASRRP